MTSRVVVIDKQQAADVTLWESKSYSIDIDLNQMATEASMRSRAVSFVEVSFPTQAHNFDTEAKIVDEEFAEVDLELGTDVKASQGNEIELRQDNS